MDGRGRSGFTLVEVPIALLILVVGVLALAGSAAMVSRLVGRGRHITTLAHTAAARMEWLRGRAWATSPPCAVAEFGSGAAVSGRVGERWEVPPAGNVRPVTLALDRAEAGGVAHDTLRTAILCR